MIKKIIIVNFIAVRVASVTGSVASGFLSFITKYFVWELADRALISRSI